MNRRALISLGALATLLSARRRNDSNECVAGGIDGNGADGRRYGKSKRNHFRNDSRAITTQAHRSVKFISPSTTTIYIALQTTPGHGNPAFSYTEQVNDQNCVANNASNEPPSRACSFTISLPIGTETLSILATCSYGIPLSYANYGLTIAADGSYQLTQGPSSNALAGIIASASTTYLFGPIALSAPPPYNTGVPALSTQVFDAAGDQLSLNSGDPYPLNTISTYTVTQSTGQFLDVGVAHTTFAFPQGSPVNTITTGPLGPTATQFFVEVGNGTTSNFTTSITTTTPQVQYTQTEFPALPSATATVDASTSTLTLTCQFLTVNPASDPCPGAVPANFSLN